MFKGIHPMMKGMPCELAVGTIKNIVASGMVFKREEPNEVVYGVPLTKDDVRVVIDLAFDRSVPLPIPVVGNVETVFEATNAYVPWPKNLVIIVVDLDADMDADADADMDVDVVVDVDVDVDEKVKKAKRLHRELVGLSTKTTKDIPKMPPRVKSIFRYAEHTMKNDALLIPIADHVFGSKINFLLMRDDIKKLCRMEEISSTIIAAYIASLCEKNPKVLEKYAFVDPHMIFHGLGLEEDRSQNLCTRLRLINKNKVIIIPCNSGCHWTLIVISLESGTIFSIDSIRHRIRDEIRNIVNMAMKMYCVQENVKGLKFGWKIVKCPQQPGYTECGYYVMKFMRDIVITKKDTMIADVLMRVGPYTQREIDVIRTQCANFLRRYI